MLATLYTGKTIVRSYERSLSNTSQRGSPAMAVAAEQGAYAHLAQACFGGFGSAVVNVLVTVEFFCATSVCLLMVWRNVIDLCGNDCEPWWVIVGSIVLILPTIWVERFSELSFIRYV